MARDLNTVDMITAHGNFVWYDDPSLTFIDPNDIRTHSINMCRYNGAIDWHLVRHHALVTLLARAYRQAFFGFINTNKHVIQTGAVACHDYHEPYVGDMVSGLKKHAPDWCKIEVLWENAVHTAIGIPMEVVDHDFVKFCDLKALLLEMVVMKHPAADRVNHWLDRTSFSDNVVGALQERDYRAINAVREMTPEECWNVSWHAVGQARLILQHEEKTEVQNGD